MNYWKSGDLISGAKMRRMDSAIYENRADILALLANNPVLISNEEPPEDNYLWIDTQDSYYDGDLTYEEDEETGELINIPTFIDTPLMQHLVDLIKGLSNEISSLKVVIKTLQGQIDDLYDRIGDGDNIVGNNNYLGSEDGITFITEDGDLFIAESGTSSNVNTSEGLLAENGTAILTEDGHYILPEK